MSTANNINYLNLLRRQEKEARTVTIEMFGAPIAFVNNMVRLKDIQVAYLNEIGERSEDSTRPARWLRSDTAKDLIDYLSEEALGLYPENGPVDEAESGPLECLVLGTPLGRSGGLYACREIAHAYAMWLDVRYAVHVLRAFDQLVAGDLTAAHRTASKVARRFVAQEWEVRHARLVAADPDGKPEDYFKYMIQDFFREVSDCDLKNALDFRNYVYANIGDSLIFERILNSMEIAWKCVDDAEAAEKVCEQYVNDPDFPVLADIIKDYCESHN